MPSYLLVVNPKSGRGRALTRSETLRAALAESNEVEVVETKARGYASEVVSRRSGEFDRVVAIGGDGTLNEVLTGLVDVGAPADELPALGFLGSGTANAAIQAFGLSGEPMAVARALPGAEARPVDVGIASFGDTERPFLLWFGAGYDAIVIDVLNTERTGLMGIAGLVRKSPSVVRAVHRYSAPEITIRTDDEQERRAASVILANVAEMAFGGTASPAADPFDGRLEVLMVPRSSTAGVAGLFLRMMTSSLDRGRGVGHVPATRVRLEAEGEVPFQLDGEPVGTLPAEVRVRPGAVRLLLT